MASPLRAFGSGHHHRPFEGRLDTRKRRRFKEQTRALPKCPGVYFFYGRDDRLLYIGKAKCLRERVRSYFADTSAPRPPKIRRLLLEIERMDFVCVGSELEALLLERSLIARWQPLLNRQHKRFEVYPYLLLSEEEFPRLTITRAQPLEGEADDETRLILREMSEAMKREARPLETPEAGQVPGLYLGPFTTPRHAYWALDALVKLFPLRLCEDELRVDPAGLGCFYREIGRCCGPCIGQTPVALYRELCDELVSLLRTGESVRLEALKARMNALADQWKFEEAGRVKAQIEAIELVAARLRRLERMRRHNNALIVQPALSRQGQPQTTLFLVRGGAVRRHLCLDSSERAWHDAARQVRALFGEGAPVPAFTAKTELDEMMILDRWLRSHGHEECVAWMNEESRGGRQWLSNAMRRLRSASRALVAPDPSPPTSAPTGKIKS